MRFTLSKTIDPVFWFAYPDPRRDLYHTEPNITQVNEAGVGQIHPPLAFLMISNRHDNKKSPG